MKLASSFFKAEFELLKFLPPNPRTIKRFDNAFRLQLLILNNIDPDRSFNYDEIESIARLVVLRFSWPKVIDQMIITL